jgi:hypothetical protein
VSFPGGQASRRLASVPGDGAPSPRRALRHPGEPAVWTFTGCEVHEYPDAYDNGFLETVWPDGAKCPATRDHTMQNADYASQLGYGCVRDALREHELAHTFVAEALGFPYSLTLRAVALGFTPGCAPYEFQLWEESVVLDFQRYLNTGEIGPALNPYRPLTPRWAEEFRRRFLNTTR